MAVLYEVSGRSVDAESLIHAVLHLEQVLTTGMFSIVHIQLYISYITHNKVVSILTHVTSGGGWQDQVGGLMPGVKIGRSAPELPLHVTVERLQLPDGFLETLNQHLLLVYTGKTRLARNLLQVGYISHLNLLSSCVLCGRILTLRTCHVTLLCITYKIYRCVTTESFPQDVLRNWYARLPDILQNVDALVSNAELCAESFRRGETSLPEIWATFHSFDL